MARGPAGLARRGRHAVSSARVLPPTPGARSRTAGSRAAGTGATSSSTSPSAEHRRTATSRRRSRTSPAIPLTYHWFADFHGAIAATAAGSHVIPVFIVTSALMAGRPGPRRLGAGAPPHRGAGGSPRSPRSSSSSAAAWAGSGSSATSRGRRRRPGPRPGAPRTTTPGSRRLAVLPDRLDPRDRASFPHRATTFGLPGPGHGRPPGAWRAWAAGRPGSLLAGRPRRAPRAVPLLLLPGDLPARRPVRPDDRRLAGADGLAARRRAVPGPGRARAPVRRRRRRSCQGDVGAFRFVLGWSEAPLRRRARRRSLFFYLTNLGIPLVLAIVAARPARRLPARCVPRRLGGRPLPRPQPRRGQRGRVRHEQVLPDHVDRRRDPRRRGSSAAAAAGHRGRRCRPSAISPALIATWHVRRSGDAHRGPGAGRALDRRRTRRSARSS